MKVSHSQEDNDLFIYFILFVSLLWKDDVERHRMVCLQVARVSHLHTLLQRESFLGNFPNIFREADSQHLLRFQKHIF